MIEVHVGAHNSAHNLARQRCEALLNHAQSIIRGGGRRRGLEGSNAPSQPLKSFLTPLKKFSRKSYNALTACPR